MNETQVLLNIIRNIKADQVEAVFADCKLLPRPARAKIENAYAHFGPEDAIHEADKLLGNI